MLTALKIGLLALMPLSMNHPGDSDIWTLTEGEQNINLRVTFQTIESMEAFAILQMTYNNQVYVYDDEYNYNNLGDYGYLAYSINGDGSGDMLIWVEDSALVSMEGVTIEDYHIYYAQDGEPDYTSHYLEYDLSIQGDGVGWDSADNDTLTEAIEQDIANANMPSISDIFAEVTSAITSFVGSLGQAFNSVTALFYANGNWTFLGVLVLIGVGVGLVYGAYRLIKGLLHRV